MSKARTEMPTTSFRWGGESEFVDTLETLQEEGELPEGVSRSQAMRAVLDAWTEDPDTSIL